MGFIALISSQEFAFNGDFACAQVIDKGHPELVEVRVRYGLYGTIRQGTF